MQMLLNTLLARTVKRGHLTVVMRSGRSFVYGDLTGKSVRIRFTSRMWQARVTIYPQLRLGEAYMNEGLVFEEGTIADLLDLIARNFARPPKWIRRSTNLRMWIIRHLKQNAPWRSRRNVAHHYDLDARLYDLFLDSDLQYSCGYFRSPRMSLEAAQAAKKKHITAKLYIKPGQRVLDIGSGWGGLALDIAEKEDVEVVGITLSSEQLAAASSRARERKLDHKVRFCQKDYREVSERYDRIVSVGMFEHVGRDHWDTFFRKCFELLHHDGVLLLHTIGRLDGPGESNPWVIRYIFPGGHLPSLSDLSRSVERSGFITADIEVLRLHYAHTLRHWRRRFLSNTAKLRELYDEKFIRMWEFYLASFESSFRYQGLAVLQIQLIKHHGALPITREYVYDQKHEGKDNYKNERTLGAGLRKA